MKALKNTVGILLASLLLTALSVSSAWADEGGAQASPLATSAYAHTQTSAGYPIELSVSWNTPKCGEPTVFHLECANGSGNYEYYLSSVQLDEPAYLSADARVIDPSRGSYQASPDIPFTFYASGRYDLMFYGIDMANMGNHARLRVQVVINDANYPSISVIADNVAAQCLAAGKTTDFDKALWLHDWIVNHCKYDNSLVYCGAEGVFARGTGTCESYHRSYVMLLDRVGIPTKRIEGNGHVWTGVQLDGKWYHVDVTWDDGAELSSDYPDMHHQYFCLNDEIIGYVHPDYQKSTSKIGANSLDLNYFIKTGKINQWSSPYLNTVSSNLKDGKTNFSFSTVHPHWPDNYKNVTDRLIAYDLSSRPWDGVKAPLTLSVTYADDVYAAKLVDSSSTTPSAPSSPGQSTTPSNPSVSVKPGNTDPSGSSAESSGSHAGSGTTTKPSATAKPNATTKPSAGSQAGVSGSQAGSSASSGNTSAQVASKSKGSWKKSGNRWWYRHFDGSYTRSNWELIAGTWYHFDASGWMQTGWIKKGSTWYYLKLSGAMATGWQRIGGTWYYLKSSGAMAVGWQKVGGAWYYLNGSGAMQANRWIGDYYVDGSGAMATNTWIGKYHVNANGKWDRTRG